MRLSIHAAPARAAVLASVAARAFVTMVVDAPTTHNGAYLCPLIAAALSVPWLLCVRALSRTKESLVSLLSALLLPVTLLDGAVTASEIAGSAGYLALDRVSVRVLMLPVCIAALWCVCRDGDALGYAATLWARLFPALLLLIILLQARCFRPEWLRPLLGSGWHSIFMGGIRLAGRFIPCSALLLLAKEDQEVPERSGASVGTVTVAALIAALLILLHRMMAPTPRRDLGWLYRLDGLLTNGRAPLYLQLPMICAWYAGLLHLLVCECFAGAALLQRLLHGLDGRLCAVMSVATVAVGAGFLPVSAWAEALSTWLYAAIVPVTAVAALMATRRKGGVGACA